MFDVKLLVESFDFATTHKCASTAEGEETEIIDGNLLMSHEAHKAPAGGDKHTLWQEKIASRRIIHSDEMR